MISSSIMTVMSINQILDVMCNELIISRLNIRKKENHWSVSSFLFLQFRNVLIFHLHTSFIVNSVIFDLIALSVADDCSCASFVIFIMLIYMKNLSSSVQHHKIAINVYHKNVLVKRCKKCVKKMLNALRLNFLLKKTQRNALYAQYLRQIVNMSCKYNFQ